MALPFKVVIPARYGATRLPGKPLLEIAGTPMILHVLRRAQESGAEEVIVATDDARIAAVVERAGGLVCLTRHDHRSGSDRLAEVIQRLGWPAETIVVNLQGDEPTMPAELIVQVARDLAGQTVAQVATLATPIRDIKTLFDPHAVKVVMDAQGQALYFSRAPIPWHRDEFIAHAEKLPTKAPFFRHIGLYAYRAGFLLHYQSLPAVPIELAESLEQLRILWHGGRIHVGVAAVEPGPGVDTLDDLRHLERHWLKPA